MHSEHLMCGPDVEVDQRASALEWKGNRMQSRVVCVLNSRNKWGQSERWQKFTNTTRLVKWSTMLFHVRKTELQRKSVVAHLSLSKNRESIKNSLTFSQRPNREQLVVSLNPALALLCTLLTSQELISELAMVSGLMRRMWKEYV